MSRKYDMNIYKQVLGFSLLIGSTTFAQTPDWRKTVEEELAAGDTNAALTAVRARLAEKAEDPAAVHLEGRTLYLHALKNGGFPRSPGGKTIDLHHLQEEAKKKGKSSDDAVAKFEALVKGVEMLDRAAASLKRARELDPGCRECSLDLAQLYLVMGKDAEVIEAARAALDQEAPPPVREAIIAMAEGLTDQNKFTLAADLYGILSQADPKNSSLRVAHGVCLARSCRPVEGLTILEETLKSGQVDLYAMKNLIQTRILLRRYDDAMKANQAIIAAQPGNLEAVFTRVLLLHATGAKEAASSVDAFKKASGDGEIQPILTRSLDALSGANAEKPDPAAVDKLLAVADEFIEANHQPFGLLMAEVARQKSSDDLKVWERRLKVYENVKFPDQHMEAFLECRKRAAEDPQLAVFYANPKAMLTVGTVYFHEGLMDVAEKVWQRCIQEGYDDASVRVHLGRIAVERKQLDAARKEFELAIARKEPAVDVLKAEKWIYWLDHPETESPGEPASGP